MQSMRGTNRGWDLLVVCELALVWCRNLSASYGACYPHVGCMPGLQELLPSLRGISGRNTHFWRPGSLQTLEWDSFRPWELWEALLASVEGSPAREKSRGEWASSSRISSPETRQWNSRAAPARQPAAGAQGIMP